MSNSRSFILKCSMCFKVFDYHVKMTNSKASLWNFITIAPRTTRSYAVFCAENISKANNLIKVALNKLPQDHRLIVITHNPTADNIKLAIERDYGLLSYDELNTLSEQMVGAKNLDLDNISKSNSEQDESPNDFVDKVLSKERLL